MSDLVPSVIPLSAGLSLQVPKLMAPPGSLLDVLNYEQVDMQGQKRIDGYARYDGGHVSALDDFKIIDSTDMPPDFQIINDLIVVDGGVMAVILGSAGEEIHVASLNDNLMPPYRMGRDVYPDPEQHYQFLLDYMQRLRVRTERLPGAVAGLHWFRDRLYAVADTARIAVDTSVTLFPNDILEVNGQLSKVLKAERVDSNKWHVFISTMNADDWAAPGVTLLRQGVAIGVTVAYRKDEDVIPVASFYESRSEQQAVEEDGVSAPDFGWRFVDLGWSLGFREGLSLYGGLPALNQNLGAIGAGWSGTGGNTGSPLVLTQDVNITNSRNQVNGWKNSNTPATYGLSPSNITSTDSSYIYADAYVSWDGETRAITVPRDNLTEYPPTATVEVDV